MAMMFEFMCPHCNAQTFTVSQFVNDMPMDESDPNETRYSTMLVCTACKKSSFTVEQLQSGETRLNNNLLKQ